MTRITLAMILAGSHIRTHIDFIGLNRSPKPRMKKNLSIRVLLIIRSRSRALTATRL
jgi:hypothetical protein